MRVHIHLRLFHLICIASLPILSCYGQIFPGFQGEELVNELQQAYTPTDLLNETQARDTLYAKIFLWDDSVRCIYSGLARFLPTGVDPSQFLFGSSNETESINLEHGWPQAKGAGDGTNGNMDMHHLYPSRVEINSDRGNFPFREIDDDTTEKWYYQNIETTIKPVNHIDAYSEFIPGAFEPRENVKGDIARAMFYFWTIYRDDAIEADPLFFDLQRDYLCQWHLDDPVDAFEALRNDRIAGYQGGIKNPFILDCTLPKRAYCNKYQECEIVSVSINTRYNNAIIWDPSNNQIMIDSESESEWVISLVNIYGQVVLRRHIVTGNWTEPVHLSPGIYFLAARSGELLISRPIFFP